MPSSSDAPELLIIGAGPYGLSAAAYARYRGVAVQVAGKFMESWREKMPAGMFLRSASSWHMDPVEEHTFAAFLAERGLSSADCDPIPLQLFLEYSEWFRQEKGIEVMDARVQNLSHADGQFVARLHNGDELVAPNVLCAPGMSFFAVIPPEYESLKRDGNGDVCHTSQLGALDQYRGKRCVIVGGRQSAFEYAALLAEAGAAEVHVVHRHETPSFEASDWSWVEPMMAECGRDPGWYRALPQSEREQIARRFWAEGRLKLEPWLTDRLHAGNVKVHQKIRVQSVHRTSNGIDIELDNGLRLSCDQLILATGFKVDVSRIPYLDVSTILSVLETHDGYPMLSPTFESNIPGLYFTGMCAARDFGPFFGFIRACNVSARTIIDSFTDHS